MPRLPLLSLILAAGVLSACQMTSPGTGGGTGEAVTPNAVAGSAIETTALDAPPADAEADAAAPAVAAEGNALAAPQGTSPDNGTGTAVDPVAADPEPAPEAELEPVPEAELEPVPEAPKSERQLACERKKGRWEKVGLGELRACVFPTRDGGQSCRKESDCEGVCLARSGTCAPFKPLFGCNEVLQENGARGTLCIQ
jgi:hypothetical protein